MSLAMMSMGFRMEIPSVNLAPMIDSISALRALSFSRWCWADLKRLKQAAQGIMTSSPFFCAIIRFLAGSATESL